VNLLSAKELKQLLFVLIFPLHFDIISIGNKKVDGFFWGGEQCIKFVSHLPKNSLRVFEVSQKESQLSK